MAIDRKRFFDAVRHAPFGGTLTPSQVAGMEHLLTEAPEGMAVEPLAYCLATAYWETARTMRPIEEYGKGKGKAYGRPDPETGQTYYGRGFVQLTWRANYDKAGKVLLADLVKHPELALIPDLAARIMFRGMTEGWFTTHKLSDYFGPGKSDPVGARRIINGQDKAQVIAGFHAAFLIALNSATVAEALVAHAKLPEPPSPAKLVETQPQPSWWDRLLGRVA